MKSFGQSYYLQELYNDKVLNDRDVLETKVNNHYNGPPIIK